MYRQQDEGADDISMAAIILDRSVEQEVRNLARRLGVGVDLERCVTEQAVEEVKSNQRGVPVLDWFVSGERKEAP